MHQYDSQHGHTGGGLRGCRILVSLLLVFYVGGYWAWSHSGFAGVMRFLLILLLAIMATVIAKHMQKR